MPANLDSKGTVIQKINLEKEVTSMRSKATEMQSIVDQSAEHLRKAIVEVDHALAYSPIRYIRRSFPCTSSLCSCLAVYKETQRRASINSSRE